MGNTTSVQSEPTPVFVIKTRKGAEDQLILNEQLDKYNAACLASAPNRAAAPTVEPTSPPVGAEEHINQVELEPWLRDGIRGTAVCFFIDGLPHTREFATIWLPYHMPSLNRILTHEAIHIHQRIHGKIWREIYESVFNMKPWNGTLPSELESRRRLNPDTILWPHYSWSNYIPVMVFLRPDAPRLTETRLIWYNKGDGSWSMASPRGFVEFFGSDAASPCEHPNEMAAYFLTEEPTSPTMREMAATLRATLRFKFRELSLRNK